VDDNATNRHILVRYTESWGMVARDTPLPAEALEWIHRGDPFDLAILDMQMPEVDGITLAKEIRRYRDVRALPLVLLTSLGLLPDAPGNAEFAAHMTKPIKPSQLFDALMRIYPEPSSQQVPAGPETPVEPSGERVPLRILVVEDNPVNQQLATLLVKKVGHGADVVSNGLEALEALEREPYDVVLMDVQMPEMDGLEATRRIYERWPEGRRPYIIAATANALREEREACLAAGMDDYLSKPIRIEQLRDALGRCSPLGGSLPVADGTESSVPEKAPWAPESEPQRERVPDLLDQAALERLQETTGGDPDLLTAVVDAFLGDAPRLIDGARQAMKQGRLDEIRRAAHTLKSNGATFGAIRFSELCRELESLAKSGAVERSAAYIERIGTEYESVKAALITVRERLER
jgi:CheY-like chemotaxis protein